MKKKKKETRDRQEMPTRVWEDETEEIPESDQKKMDVEIDPGDNFNPFTDDDVEGE